MSNIIIGVLVVLIASVLTLYAGIPGAVENNTAHRIESEKNDIEILKTLVRIEANQAILLKEYDRNVSR
jgi:hypothetical protein